MSEVTPGGSPCSASGAVYAGEPVTAPSEVSNPPMIRAIPKSVSCGSPYSVSRMFAGLTSRCRVPRRCAIVERAGHLDPDMQRIAPADRTGVVDLGLQRTVRVVLHHDVRPTGGGGADLENVDDVRMAGQLAHRHLLPHEPLQIVRLESRSSAPSPRPYGPTRAGCSDTPPRTRRGRSPRHRRIRQPPTPPRGGSYPPASAAGRCWPSVVSISTAPWPNHGHPT